MPRSCAPSRHTGSPSPGDLREFVQYGLPTGDRWPNWRAAEPDAYLASRIDVSQLVAFDVQHGYWFSGWGERPASMDEATALAVEITRRAPRLIPIYAHRYMPDRPTNAGNPVYSTLQVSDTVYYGYDLAGYLEKEFAVARPSGVPAPEKPRVIEFWTQLLGECGRP